MKKPAQLAPKRVATALAGFITRPQAEYQIGALPLCQTLVLLSRHSSIHEKAPTAELPLRQVHQRLPNSRLAFSIMSMSAKDVLHLFPTAPSSQLGLADRTRAAKGTSESPVVACLKSQGPGRPAVPGRALTAIAQRDVRRPSWGPWRPGRAKASGRA
jgi:hypothetical protein